MKSRLALALALAYRPRRGILQQSTQGQSRPVTPADYLRWRTELRNSGRWGANDQKGTANLITPASAERGQVGALRGRRSRWRIPCRRSAADVPAGAVFHRTTNAISPPHHRHVSGQLSRPRLSHTDAFCHFSSKVRCNGYRVSENITPETGCKNGSIMGRREGICHARRAVRHAPIEERRLD
jgi:hypothetical protein